jgi:hypothetical protein
MENQKSDNLGKNKPNEPTKSFTIKTAEKLPAAGWGFQFLWIGIALLLKIKPGLILQGIGAIVLLLQVVRKYLNLRLQIYIIVLGFLFMIGGFIESYNPESPIIPIFLIIVGTGLLLSFIKHIISK